MRVAHRVWHARNDRGSYFPIMCEVSKTAHTFMRTCIAGAGITLFRHEHGGAVHMLKHIVLIALLAKVGSAVMAQLPPTLVSDTVLQKCLLGTYDPTWTALHLSADQLTRIRLVQSACREECDMAAVHKVRNPISNANGSTVLGEVKNILTVEQYAAWVASCTEASSNGKPAR